jgi:hypothetical protein
VIEMPDTIGRGDPLYLFLCHLDWRRTRNLAAYQELLGALNDSDPEICLVAEALLHEIHRAALNQRTQVLKLGKALDRLAG